MLEQAKHNIAALVEIGAKINKLWSIFSAAIVDYATVEDIDGANAARTRAINSSADIGTEVERGYEGDKQDAFDIEYELDDIIASIDDDRGVYRDPNTGDITEIGPPDNDNRGGGWLDFLRGGGGSGRNR